MSTLIFQSKISKKQLWIGVWWCQFNPTTNLGSFLLGHQKWLCSLLILIYFGKKDRLIFRFPGMSFLIRIISFLAAASNTFSFTRSTDSVVCCYLLTFKTVGTYYMCLGICGKNGIKFYAFPFCIIYGNQNYRFRKKIKTKSLFLGCK